VWVLPGFFGKLFRWLVEDAKKAHEDVLFLWVTLAGGVPASMKRGAD